MRCMLLKITMITEINKIPKKIKQRKEDVNSTMVWEKFYQQEKLQSYGFPFILISMKDQELGQQIYIYAMC